MLLYLRWPIKTIARCATPWTEPKAVVHCSTAVPRLVALDLYQVLPAIASKLTFCARALLLPGVLSRLNRNQIGIK